ncbi:Nuclear pore complex protein [Hordeum vulgare]|nr:Nuclear pore complex protein [Hordeum vulgare]
MREGMLHIHDVEGPKKTGSMETRLEAMEQQVFKCQGMVERGLNANHMMITEFTNKHKIDANDIGKHLSRLYDRIDQLQGQIYDLQNQNYSISRMAQQPSYYIPCLVGHLIFCDVQMQWRKRLSSSNESPMLGTSVCRFSKARALHDGSSIPRRPNPGLLLEDVKQEATDYSDIDGLNGPKLFGSAKRTSLDGGSGRRGARSALNLVKLEDDMPREGETTSTTFASLLDSAIQGLMPFSDVILQFERTCRNASESLRYAATGNIRMVEDKLMQQKAKLLLDEAASWSLLWYLYWKANEELPKGLFMVN